MLPSLLLLLCYLHSQADDRAVSRGTEGHLCNLHRPREGLRPSPEGGDLENHEGEAGTAGESSKFNVEVGLHQGSALSPYLFLILMDVLTERARTEAPESMLFADDIVLCGDKDVDMTEYLESWRKALEERGMRVSIDRRPSSWSFLSNRMPKETDHK